MPYQKVIKLFVEGFPLKGYLRSSPRPQDRTVIVFCFQRSYLGIFHPGFGAKLFNQAPAADNTQVSVNPHDMQFTLKQKFPRLVSLRNFRTVRTLLRGYNRFPQDFFCNRVAWPQWIGLRVKRVCI